MGLCRTILSAFRDWKSSVSEYSRLEKQLVDLEIMSISRPRAKATLALCLELPRRMQRDNPMERGVDYSTQRWEDAICGSIRYLAAYGVPDPCSMVLGICRRIFERWNRGCEYSDAHRLENIAQTLARYPKGIIPQAERTALAEYLPAAVGIGLPTTSGADLQEYFLRSTLDN